MTIDTEHTVDQTLSIDKQLWEFSVKQSIKTQQAFIYLIYICPLVNAGKYESITHEGERELSTEVWEGLLYINNL